MPPLFNRNNKKALLFDLHGTLIDREQSRLVALQQVLEDYSARWEGEGWSPEQAVRRFAAAWRKYPKKNEEGLIRCLQKALHGSPLSTGETFARTVWKLVKEASSRHAVPYPGVKETLRELAKTYRLAIVSNGSRTRLEQTLKASGLDALFPADLRFVSDRRGIKKPHPDLFLGAMRKLGVTPRETVMIGDSWRNDVYGASRCGIDAVWLRRRQRTGSKRPGRIGKARVVPIAGIRQLLSVFETG